MKFRNLFIRNREQPGWRCPDETILAAYVDRQLDTSARQSLEDHLSRCDSCLDQVSFLIKTADQEGVAPVPAALLARTRKLVGEQKSPLKSYRAWGWAAAAAACLLLAGVFLIARQGSKSPKEQFVAKNEPTIEAPPITPAPTPSPAISPNIDRPNASVPEKASKPTPATAVRSDAASAVSPTLIFPTERSSIKAGDLTLRWKPVSDVLFYEVSVMNQDGDQVLSLRTQQTELNPSANLLPGQKYFVQITAALREGKTVKSNLVSFRVSP